MGTHALACIRCHDKKLMCSQVKKRYIFNQIETHMHNHIDIHVENPDSHVNSGQHHQGVVSGTSQGRFSDHAGSRPGDDVQLMLSSRVLVCFTMTISIMRTRAWE